MKLALPVKLPVNDPVLYEPENDMKDADRAAIEELLFKILVLKEEESARYELENDMKDADKAAIEKLLLIILVSKLALLAK